ncbi:MAG: nucleotidyltransferase family protein [Tepidanaerobacteraceae bacterium]|jgi:molybdenum cofactor cytidylyltransferase|nr:nucleotidyltransferase family protein [Tepidanaerobacteraceae bacterium]
MNICGIILAAGEGKRAGGKKLSRKIKSLTLLEWTLRNASVANLEKLIVVTGYEKDFAEKLCLKYNVEPVYNEKYASGMSWSLKKGLSALPKDISGFVIILGDMPFVKTETIDNLVHVFKEHNGIVIPTYSGEMGHPRVFSAKYKAELMNITGDVGARMVVKKYSNDIMLIEVDDPGVIKDYDYFDETHGIV